MDRNDRTARVRKARIARTLLGCSLLFFGGSLLGTALAAAYVALT